MISNAIQKILQCISYKYFSHEHNHNLGHEKNESQVLYNGQRKIRTPASCTTAIGANTFAMQHPYNFVNLKAFILLLTLFLKKKNPKTNTQCQPPNKPFFKFQIFPKKFQRCPLSGQKRLRAGKFKIVFILPSTETTHQVSCTTLCRYPFGFFLIF